MKKAFTLLSLIFCVSILMAQDIIITKDSKRIEAKIIEVTPTTVKYKKWTYQDGPDIYEAKSNIAAIMWGNGEVEAFNLETEKKDVATVDTIKKETPKVVEKKQNTVIAKTESNNYVVGTGSLSLVRLEDGDYMCDGKIIAKENIKKFYANNCYDAYLMYKKANTTSTVAWTLLGAGLGCTLGGSLACIGDIRTGLSFLITGLIADIACIPFACVSVKQNNKAMDIYNGKCSKKEVAKLNFGATTNGIGFILTF